SSTYNVTTASSLEAEQDSGIINRIQSTVIPNEPIPRGTGSGGRPRRQDTILGGTPAQTRVPELENVKDAQALEIQKLKKRLKWLERKRKSRTSQLKRSAPITTASVSVSTAKPSTPPTITTTLIEDEDLTIAQTLMKMRSVKSKEKSKEKGVSSTRLTREVIIKEASETASRLIVPPQQQLDLKDKGKAMMEASYELAQRLQAKEQIELTIKERSKLFVKLMDKRKKHFAKLRAEEIRIKPPTKAQMRNQMCTYLKNMANYKHSQLKNRSFKEIQMLFDNAIKWTNSFVPMDSEVLEGTRKKAKRSGKEAEICTEGTGRSSELEIILRSSIQQNQQMIKKEIWVELKRLFEQDTYDELWKLQKHIHDLSWKLYDSCGVYHVSTEKGIDIYMLVEKEYTLLRGTRTLMLVAKLLVDQDNEMSRELLRKISCKLKDQEDEVFGRIFSDLQDYRLISRRGRIVGLLSAVKVTSADMEVTTAGSSYNYWL
nr:hypothetical protein [Tanacetum cinerariifolium]GEZ59054.1 hypothetical protein [Tanacetum cinerariifolium]